MLTKDKVLPIYSKLDNKGAGMQKSLIIIVIILLVYELSPALVKSAYAYTLSNS